MGKKFNRVLHLSDCICRFMLFAIVLSMETVKILSSKEMGEKIKFRRQEIGMSQERLAEILDVSYQQIQRYENGRNRLNVENIQVIAHALSVPITFFFGPSSHYGETTLSHEINEVRTLLRYFEKIPEKPQRQVVISVARLAARKD